MITILFYQLQCEKKHTDEIRKGVNNITTYVYFHRVKFTIQQY